MTHWHVLHVTTDLQVYVLGPASGALIGQQQSFAQCISFVTR